MPHRIKDNHLLQCLKLLFDECEITGETDALHLHHVIFKSQLGDDVRANIICVTEALHTAYHNGNHDARQLLGRHVQQRRPDTALYIAEKLGSPSAYRAWLERHGVEPL